jgi:hypothetical protein
LRLSVTGKSDRIDVSKRSRYWIKITSSSSERQSITALALRASIGCMRSATPCPGAVGLIVVAFRRPLSLPFRSSHRVREDHQTSQVRSRQIEAVRDFSQPRAVPWDAEQGLQNCLGTYGLSQTRCVRLQSRQPPKASVMATSSRTTIGSNRPGTVSGYPLPRLIWGHSRGIQPYARWNSRRRRHLTTLDSADDAPRAVHPPLRCGPDDAVALQYFK